MNLTSPLHPASNATPENNMMEMFLFIFIKLCDLQENSLIDEDKCRTLGCVNFVRPDEAPSCIYEYHSVMAMMVAMVITRVGRRQP